MSPTTDTASLFATQPTNKEPDTAAYTFTNTGAHSHAIPPAHSISHAITDVTPVPWPHMEPHGCPDNYPIPLANRQPHCSAIASPYRCADDESNRQSNSESNRQTNRHSHRRPHYCTHAAAHSTCGCSGERRWGRRFVVGVGAGADCRGCHHPAAAVGRGGGAAATEEQGAPQRVAFANPPSEPDPCFHLRHGIQPNVCQGAQFRARWGEF